MLLIDELYSYITLLNLNCKENLTLSGVFDKKEEKLRLFQI